MEVESRHLASDTGLVAGGDDDSSAASAPARASTPFNLEALQQFLTQLVPLLIGAHAYELETLFDSPSFSETAQKWAHDPSAVVVYVVRSREEHDGELETAGMGLVFLLTRVKRV